jgi:hypothetical protein
MISLILVILAGMLNGVMDVLTMRYNTCVFKRMPKEWEYFFNPSLSWRNKWKNGDSNQGEKFFGSSTFLVWTTDAWHLAKSSMLFLFAMAITFYSPLVSKSVDIFIYWTAFSFTFEMCFSKFFIKK